ncbi:TlpA disulfide reductase family protein [Myxococcaceae bacterium GXIMD 01537]
MAKSLLVLTGLAGVVALVLLGVQEAKRSRLVPDGASPPGFVMQRYGGGTVTLAELKGSVVMLDFWATWCPPCREEMPSLVKLAKEYESQGLVFVAANRDDPDSAPAEVGTFIKRHQPDLAPYVVYAPDEMAVAFQVSALPTLYFLDREGKVVDAQRGMLDEDALRRRIERALNP